MKVELPTVEVPVLVVGAGPTGLTASLLLARYGVKALTITKYPGTANSPRAHITNQRTMEVFRDLDLEDRVLAVATPPHLMANSVWATSFTGRELARLQAWGNGPERRADYERASPCSMCNCPQHLMEPVLAQAAQEAGAELRFNTELISITQEEHAVTATVKDRVTEQLYTIRARYAIGADGGGSKVVPELGFPLEGKLGLSSSLNIWFEADLTRYCEHRPGTLYWLSQPGIDHWFGSGVFICVKPWSEWVMSFKYDPSRGELDVSEAAVAERVRITIGDPHLPMKIKSISKWQLNHVVASQYRRGNVFIAGDAAHRHPPANGLGSNTSIQDSFNLCWKLAYVLKGQAHPSLLDTYHAERQPVGRQVVDRAMKSFQNMRLLSEAFGLRPGQSEQEGWASLDELRADTEAGRQRRARLEELLQLQHYQFNCHGVELGQVYTSSAVVADDMPRPAPQRDPELYYEPTTYPGACVPHAWVEREKQRLSTQDLVGKGRFTLLTGIGGQPWAEAAARVGSALGVELDVRLIGYNQPYHDVYGDWARQRQVSEHGCLLVRPDRYIAWRSHGLAADPAEQLSRVMRAVLGYGA